jgi:hypothetical protein
MPEPCTCHEEVARLHRFFRGWYRGELAHESFAACEQALAPDFTIVTPSGQLVGRDEIMTAVRSHHGGEPPGFEITTVPRACRQVGEVHVSTYEEQQRGARSTVRLSTAVLIENGGRYTWHHVHETWLTTADL